MRHSKFFAEHPRADQQFFGKFTRAQLEIMRHPVWKQHKLEGVSYDPLAFRLMMLRDHGIQSVQNSIYMDHGRAKRF